MLVKKHWSHRRDPTARGLDIFEERNGQDVGAILYAATGLINHDLFLVYPTSFISLDRAN